MTSTSSATVVGGNYVARAASRDPRIVVAYNDYDGALDNNGEQRVGSSIMGVAVSDDRGQTWRPQRIELPSTASFLSAIGGSPAIAASGWMQPAVRGVAPPQSNVVYVAEAFYDSPLDPMNPNSEAVRAARLVCTTSSDGATTWSSVRVVPPMQFTQPLSPARPSIATALDEQRERTWLGFISSPDTSDAGAYVTTSVLAAPTSPCSFVNRPTALTLDVADPRTIRRVQVVAATGMGPLAVVELREPDPSATGPENDATCRFRVYRIRIDEGMGTFQLASSEVATFAAPCRTEVPNAPSALRPSHMDFAVDASIEVRVPSFSTATIAQSAHLVTAVDPSAADGVDRSEVVYRELRWDGNRMTPGFTALPAETVSDATSDGEIVFQPTVSAIVLASNGATSTRDVFVSWYQVNDNGQVRVLGRRRSAGSSQWGPIQQLHSSSPESRESICTTTDQVEPKWSQFGASVSLMDGWPARGAIGDPNARFDAFPLNLTFFTSSRRRGCSTRTLDGALFQELHASRWR